MSSAVTKVSLPGDPEYLSRVRRVAGCIAESVGFSPQETDDTALLLNEACSNAIKHGSPRGRDDRVSIAFRRSRRRFTADVTDSGDAQGRIVGSATGYGLRLMTQLADRIEFTDANPGLTVHLTKTSRK